MGWLAGGWLGGLVGGWGYFPSRNMCAATTMRLHVGTPTCCGGVWLQTAMTKTSTSVLRRVVGSAATKPYHTKTTRRAATNRYRKETARRRSDVLWGVRLQSLTTQTHHVVRLQKRYHTETNTSVFRRAVGSASANRYRTETTRRAATKRYHTDTTRRYSDVL